MYVKYLDLLADEYKEYSYSENKYIKLDKMNIFIGKNNSGKSRLMRMILLKEYNREYYVNQNIDDFIELKKSIEFVVANSTEYIQKKYKETYLSKEIINGKIYRNMEDEEKLALFICDLLYYHYNDEIYRKLQNNNIIRNRYAFTHDNKINITDNYRSKQKEIMELYDRIISEIEKVSPKTLFFPSLLSLRKLHNMDSNQNSFYNKGMSKMFYDEYFKSIKDFSDNIKTGQEVYDDMKKQLLSLNKERELFLKFEKYIGDNFFDGKDISIFIKDDDNNIYVQEKYEKPYPIYMLGDGIQTLIIITYYLYKNKNEPLKIFIDEPEIHLHPGLQRLLISKLQEYTNYQIFISTHSSSIIDICDEYDYNTSIICVDKIEGNKIAYNSAYDDMNLYELIGIRPSSLILSNCTIWVEGPTDIYYIDTYLKIFSIIKNKKKFILGYNYNYAFNGSINIASKIDFEDDESATMKINKLSKNNFLIFDSDNLNPENANYQKIQKLKEKIGDNCHVIKKLKTIENIIPPTYFHEYFSTQFNPKKKSIKPLVLNFFDNLKKKYGSDEYFKLDIPDLMAEYINKYAEKKDIKYYRKYCNSLWNSNKCNFALYFSNKLINLSLADKEKIFNETMKEYIKMIEKIYNFIDNNN